MKPAVIPRPRKYKRLRGDQRDKPLRDYCKATFRLNDGVLSWAAGLARARLDFFGRTRSGALRVASLRICRFWPLFPHFFHKVHYAKFLRMPRSGVAGRDLL